MKSFILGAFLVTAINCSGSGVPATNRVASIKPTVTTNVTFQGGIRGQVIASPIAPVERPGHANSRPLPGAVITIQSEGGGKEVARQKADGQGRFTVALPNGGYLLVPLPPRPGSRPYASSQSVRVESNKFTEVTVRYDTGIR